MTTAACCLISSNPGTANSTTLTARFSVPVKCAYCEAEYRLEYEGGQKVWVIDFEGKLRAEAQRRINSDHYVPRPLLTHTAIINLHNVE